VSEATSCEPSSHRAVACRNTPTSRRFGPFLPEGGWRTGGRPQGWSSFIRCKRRGLLVTLHIRLLHSPPRRGDPRRVSSGRSGRGASVEDIVAGECGQRTAEPSAQGARCCNRPQCPWPALSVSLLVCVRLSPMMVLGRAVIVRYSVICRAVSSLWLGSRLRSKA
jgi:hypothetical protein